MESEQIAIRAAIAPGVEVLFKTFDDFLTVAALQGFGQFTKWWALAYPDKPKPNRRQFRQYTASDAVARLPDILTKTMLTDGRTLYDALSEKRKEQST